MSSHEKGSSSWYLMRELLCIRSDEAADMPRSNYKRHAPSPDNAPAAVS
jgi:hypothetical protein